MKLDIVKQYTQIGWHLLPIHGMTNGRCDCGKGCSSPAKHPIASLVPRGFKDSSNDFDVIKGWIERYPNANIAVDLEKSELCCIDVDPRNGGVVSFEMLEAKHGKIESDVHQLSGGGGFHLFYFLPKNFSGHPNLGKGIDFKTSGYVLIYPSKTTGDYEWEASSDPLEGCIPSVLPAWVQVSERIEQDFKASRLLTAEQIIDLRAALQCVDADDYDTWIRTGISLKSAGSAGFELWHEYSSRSNKYDASFCDKKWNTFEPNQRGYESIFFEAQQNGYVNIPTAPEPVISFTQKSELTLPKLTGVLGELESYYNETCKIPQPLLAKQTALAIASVLLGRRFCTDSGNFTSLFFASVAESGCGKEHAKTAINNVLVETGMIHLLAGDGYTSAGAIETALKLKPNHISVIDELGLYLKSVNQQQNSHARLAVKSLMEIFGRLDGTYTPINKSGVGLKGATIDELQSVIHKPAISVLGLTTPATLYDELSIEMIESGFYARFLVVEGHSDYEVMPQRAKRTPVYKSIKLWVEQINERFKQVDVLNTTAGTGEPVVIEIPFRDDAYSLLVEFEREIRAMQNELKKDRLNSLLSRTCEMAYRLALIFELSRNPLALSVCVDSVEIAIEYVRSAALHNLAMVKSKLVWSQYDKETKELLEAITIWTTQKSGISSSDIAKNRPFNKHPLKYRNELLEQLVNAGKVAVINPRENKAGRASKVYISVDSPNFAELYSANQTNDS